MRGSSTADRSAVVNQDVAKTLAAFVTGLIIMFGGSLVYSNWQQRKEPIFTVPPIKREQADSVRGAPEKPLRAENVQQTASTTVTVLPENPAQDGVAPGRLAETPLSNRPRSMSERNIGNSQFVPPNVPVPKPVTAANTSALPSAPPANGDNLRQPLGPTSNSMSPSSIAPMQNSKDAPSPEQHHGSYTEVPQRAAGEPPQVHSETAPSASESKAVVVPAAEALTVQLSETLSSDHSQPGDTFRATLVSPLIVGGYLVAETGVAVQGHVETARRASRFGGGAELSVALTEFGTPDGRWTRMETGWRKVKGTRNTLTNTAKKSTGAIGFRAEPKTAVLPAGSQLTFILTAPMTATGMRLH